MKTIPFIIASAVALSTLSSCGKKETTVREEVSNQVGDALNTRDHEKLRDAAEDIKKDVKKAGEGIGESIKEVGSEIKKEVNEATK